MPRLGHLSAVVPYLLIPVVLAGVIWLWDTVATLGGFGDFIMPHSATIWARFVQLSLDGSLWRNASLTLLESVLGFGVALVLGTLVGYGLARSPALEKIVAPYVVASQAMPIPAVAPLLVLWLGFGMPPKIVSAALISFFPILVNTVVGVRSVDVESRELMRTMSASAVQVFWKLEVPAALPIYLGGLRVGITLSVIGAVVGEFVGADQGLGFMIAQARGLFDTKSMFVALIALMLTALALYLVIAGLERYLLRNRRRYA
jgi:NitT/TauT family transport system permease protein